MGNPCVPATGAKELVEHDFTWQNLSFNRHYTSLGELPLASAMGSHWSHAFAQRLVATTSATADVIWIDEKGNYERFKHVASGRFASNNQVGITLQKQAAGAPDTWILQKAGGDELGFDAAGRLQRIGKHADQISLDYCDAAEAVAAQCPIPHVLLTATHANGRRLTFEHARVSYTAPGGSGQIATSVRLTAIQSDEGELVTYAYDDKGRLDGASYGSSGLLKQYVYAELQHLCKAADGSSVANCDATLYDDLLTGVIDESNQRLATYTYGAGGKVTRSEHSGGAGRVTLDYQGNGNVLVTTPANGTKLFQYGTGAFRKPVSVTEQGGVGTPSYTTQTVYLAGTFRPGYRIDPRGHRTGYGYGPYGETTRTEGLTNTGATTPQTRRTETDPHPIWSTPVERRTYNASNALVAKQTWTYNARGQVETANQIDPVTVATRTTTTTYCEQADVDAPGSTCPILGLRKAIDGPRTDVADVTTFAYYPSTDESGCTSAGPCHRKGDLWTVSNALGQAIWHLRYDRAGRLLRSADSNGTLTDFEYHPRGWLSKRTVRARADGVPDAGDAITHIDYLAIGLVDRVTQPDGSYIDYDYDPAQRLTSIRDRLGNRIDYVLDAAGNRIEEKTFDPGNQLRRRLAREYNQLGRLWKERDAVVDGANPNGRLLAEHHYDGNGNRDWTLDGLSRQSDHEYDPLDRLKKTLDALNPRGITQYGYDALDRLVTVTDPKNLVTEYVYDGLGDQRELRSPDTGTTVFTYDSAGNRQTQTDARSLTATYGHDALNRPTSISYPDASLNVSFQYDQANAVTGCTTSYPVGRLTRLLDASGSTTFCYDRRGNVTRKTQVTAGQTLVLTQTWTLADQLATLTYPDGAVASYGRDVQGRVTTLTVTPAGGSATAVLTNITYLPFGPAQTYSFASGGQTLTRSFDQNYGLTDVVAPGLALHFRRDVLGNIDRLGTAPGAATAIEQYAYDPLYRLKDVLTPTGGPVEGYTYDATGNRLSKTASGVTEAYTYPASNHRLSGVGGRGRTHDANGNTTAFEGLLLEYDQRNRLSRWCAPVGGERGLSDCLNWQYNGRGERVATVPDLSADWMYFLYGEGGSLLSEQRTGYAARHYLWADNQPVAVLDGSALHYVHADHLGTPRAVSTPAGPVIWTWPFQANPFGERSPNEDADGNGKTFVFGLRFPGQYQDPGSRISYNYFRDYEAATGRYLESDPIGLRAGFSTYAYVGSNTLVFVDPLGLQANPCGLGYRSVPISSTTYLCERDPGSQNALRRCLADESVPGCMQCSPGSIDCLLLDGSNPNSAYNNTNLCEYNRLGNNICYTACMSRRREDRNNPNIGGPARAIGRGAGFLGTATDWGISLWDVYEDHHTCLSECGIDMNKPCACND